MAPRSPQSSESLAQQLRTANKRIKALEAKVRILQARVDARPHQQPSPPCSTLVQPSTGNQFTFRLESPGQQDNASSKNRPTELSSLLKLVPKTEADWTCRRELVGFSTSTEIITTFWGLVYCTKSRGTTPYIANHHAPAAEGILTDYKGFVNSLQTDSIRATQRCNYTMLLFVCLCRVARKAGVSVETIDNHMDDVLPVKNSAKKRSSHTHKKTRTAVLWPLRQAEALGKKALNRSYEFFFLFGPTIPTYRALLSNNEQGFADTAILPSPPFRGEINDAVSLSIPFMVKLIVGSLFTLDLVNESLETNLTQEDFDRKFEAVWLLSPSLEYPLPKKRRLLDHEDRSDPRHATSSPVSDSDEDSSDHHMADADDNLPRPTGSRVRDGGVHSKILFPGRSFDSSISDADRTGLSSSRPEQIFYPRDDLLAANFANHPLLSSSATPLDAPDENSASYSSGTATTPLRSPKPLGQGADETSLQQVLGQAVPSPASWLAHTENGPEGQQVAETLLQLRGAQVPSDDPQSMARFGRSASPPSNIFCYLNSAGDDWEFDTRAFMPLEQYDVSTYTNNAREGQRFSAGSAQ